MPTEAEIENIYSSAFEDNSKCTGSNQWTTWRSAINPAENNGNDYEIIDDHKRLFK